MLDYLNKNGIIIALILLLLIFFQTCGNVDGKDFKKVTTAMEDQQKQIDSLENVIADKVVTEDELKEILKTTVLWETLRVEEISDKEKISINALKTQSENE